jgi:hypothetical protein
MSYVVHGCGDRTGHEEWCVGSDEELRRAALWDSGWDGFHTSQPMIRLKNGDGADEPDSGWSARYVFEASDLDDDPLVR